jgi:hypothetical protein
MAATPELAPQVMSIVAQERHAPRESWQLLPWRIWVPAVALTLALLVSVLVTSVGAWPTAEQAEALLSSWTTSATDWLGTLKGGIDPDLFWALWSGVFVTTAGLGLSLGLRAWSDVEQDERDHLVEHPRGGRPGVWGRLRGAH